MRFLCLHGRGTNSDIFEAQLGRCQKREETREDRRRGHRSTTDYSNPGPLTSRLAQAHEFDFIDGEIECKAAPGVDSFYPPPYLCYHARHETPYIQSAHEYINTVIEEDGPYDGIIGFSQGAALAASILLARQIEQPYTPPPFRIAIFICSALPYSPSPVIGLDISREFPAIEAKMAAFLGISDGEDHTGAWGVKKIDGEATASWPSSSSSSMDSLDESSRSSSDSGSAPKTYGFGFGLGPKSRQAEARIYIPTVHIIGRVDPWADHSALVRDSCQKDKMYTKYHAGGHEVPKTESELDECAGLINLAISLSLMDC